MREEAWQLRIDDLYEAGVVLVVTTTTGYEAEEAAGCQRRGVSASRSS